MTLAAQLTVTATRSRSGAPTLLVATSVDAAGRVTTAETILSPPVAMVPRCDVCGHESTVSPCSFCEGERD